MKYLDEISKTANVLKLQEKKIKKIVEILKTTRKNGNHVFIIGVGGSASTASHMLCDLLKIDKIKSASLCDNLALITALTNDDGWSSVFVEQLKVLLAKGDVLIVFSVHGGSGSDKAGPWSQNLLKAIDFTRRKGGKVIGFSGFDGGEMAKPGVCDVCVTIPSNSTPIVESFHLVLEHYLAFELQRGHRK